MLKRLLTWLRGPQKPTFSPADLQRMQAAEAKRQRKRERLKNVQAN